MGDDERTTLRGALMEGGQFRYRCANGGYNAVSDDLLVACLWHGPECIDWYLQVDPEQVAPFIEAALAPTAPGTEPLPYEGDK